MSIADRPHFELPAAELALWLEDQGSDRWWTVDGDPVLTGRVSFPCPVDELIAELRSIDLPLLVLDKQERSSSRGQSIRANDLDDLADRLESIDSDRVVFDRLFYLCWKGTETEWALAEDSEASASAAREAAGQQGVR